MESKKFTPRELMRYFIGTDKLHRSLVESRMSDLKLHRSQHHMLVCISGFESPPTQKMIAERLDISPATVTVTVKKLEAAGYVTKICDENDNRCNTISITKKGRDTLARGKEIIDNIDSSMFKGFTDEEICNFVDCLVKIQNNLTACGATMPHHCGK